jgi:hypothetical protein
MTSTFVRTALVASLCACLSLHPSQASAEEVESATTSPAQSEFAVSRRGFTLELGLGLAHTATLGTNTSGVSTVGLAPLSLSLGGCDP